MASDSAASAPAAKKVRAPDNPASVVAVKPIDESGKPLSRDRDLSRDDDEALPGLSKQLAARANLTRPRDLSSSPSASRSMRRSR
jgi:hypothetical protein